MSYYRNKLTCDEFSNRELENSYDLAWNEFKSKDGFHLEYLNQSRDLFTFKNGISPKDLNVKAVILGLEFSQNIQNIIKVFQEKLASIIGCNDYYLVKTKNLAIEVIVTKWHDENNRSEIVDNDVLKSIKKFIDTSLQIELKGYQIHTDGCIVARVFDNGLIRKLRYDLKIDIKDLPEKQSSWCHIPVGRILSQISIDQKNKIENLIDNLNQNTHAVENISSIKYINEEKWFMERYTIIDEIKLPIR